MRWLRPAGVIAVKDLRRSLRSRAALIAGVIAPIGLALIIGLAFGGSGGSVKLHIGVVDADGSSVSAGIATGLLEQFPAGTPLEFSSVADVDTARSRVDDGDVGAAIVIPQGFGAAVAGSSPQPLQVLETADQRITGGVADSVASQIAARLSASRLAVATALAAGSQPPDAATIARISAEAASVEIPVSLTQEAPGRAWSPVAYFAPAMAMLFLFFSVGAGARSLLVERREGTLARVRAAPVSDAAILVGKTASVVFLGLASFATVWLVTTVVFRAHWGNPVGVAIVVVGVVLAIAGISMLVSGLATTDAQADGVTAIVAFTLALLGGNFLSPGSMPEVLRRLSLATPNGWALRALTELGAGRGGVSVAVPAFAVLVAIGLTCGAVGLLLTRRRVIA